MDDPQIPTTEPPQFDPAPPAPDAPPAPSYVTDERLTQFGDELVTRIASSFQTQTPTPPPPAVTEPSEDPYKALEQTFYDNPAAAFKQVAEMARQQTIKELEPVLTSVYSDYSTRSATAGMGALEAEYVQDLVQKGVVTHQAMQNEAVKDLVMRGAKQYAAEKGGNKPAPTPETGIGAPINYNDPEIASRKSAFESIFGMKFEDAVKEATR